MAETEGRPEKVDWRHYWKSILAFLTLVLTNAAVDLMTTGKPWPATLGEWGRWAASTLLGTWIVYRVPNAPKYRDGTPA